jgi:hypothetical protein
LQRRTHDRTSSAFQRERFKNLLLFFMIELVLPLLSLQKSCVAGRADM